MSRRTRITSAQSNNDGSCHELATIGGKVAFFGGSNTAAWHGLGTIVEGQVSSKEALKLANLDWEVTKTPIKTLKAFAEDGTAITITSPDFLITRPGDNTAQDIPANVVHLGTVGSKYVPVQNVEAFDFFDSIIGEGHAFYETAGALYNGQKVWILADIPAAAFGAEVGDETKVKVMLSNSHDGTGCVEARIVPVRTCCANTYSIAIKSGKNVVKIRHLNNWNSEAKVAQAKEILGIVKDYGTLLSEKFNAFRAKPITGDEFEKTFLDGLFPIAGKEGKGKAQVENKRQLLAELFLDGTGTNGETVWDAFNAVTEFANHKATFKETAASTREENRFSSIFDGEMEKMIQKAFDLSDAFAEA